MSTEARSFTSDQLMYAARAARLNLSADRLEVVGPALEGIYALIDTLDAFSLGETPPATAFDARWDT
jgi:Asp-tRNA(Asn)/Glu-tRNA(Gln) amidotransferase C subunit